LPRLRLTAAARRDLDAIYDYGFATFGQATADRYAAMLVATAQALLAFPLMVTSRHLPQFHAPLTSPSSDALFNTDPSGTILATGNSLFPRVEKENPGVENVFNFPTASCHGLPWFSFSTNRSGASSILDNAEPNSLDAKVSSSLAASLLYPS
jgi:plasmid stabilization system protein ParE